MANLAVVDAGGDTVYLKGSGAGTSGDPIVLERSGAVTISSSALPSGAATATRQDAQTTLLGRLPAEGDAADYLTVRLTDGSAFYSASGGGGGGGAVTVADGASVALGATTDSAASTDTGTATLIALVKRLLSRITTLLPQSGGRLSVDGSGVTQPVSASSLPLPTGAATAARQDAVAVLVGAVDETAPVSDTASSGLNGRLQRIAQRLTTVNTSIGSVLSALQSTIAISASSLPLPTGAATSAAQTTGNSSLSSIDGKLPTLVSSRVPVDGSGVTQPISASSLPLPTGAATSSAQTTGNSSLSSIDGKLPALRTLQSVAIAASSSGNTQVVAAVAGQRIYVAGFYASVNGAVNVKFQSATTDISGLFYGQTAGNGIVAPYAAPPAYWCRTASGEALNINLSQAVAVGGQLMYWTE